MNATCEQCDTVFRIDPAKLPRNRVRALCSICRGVFEIRLPESDDSGQPMRESPFPFGSADPGDKARRLARALVSDIVTYHPERRDRSLEAGTLKLEFGEEIKKSWDEYVDRVGPEMARGTPHFRTALNDILAGGKRIF